MRYKVEAREAGAREAEAEALEKGLLEASDRRVAAVAAVAPSGILMRLMRHSMS